MPLTEFEPPGFLSEQPLPQQTGQTADGSWQTPRDAVGPGLEELLEGLPASIDVDHAGDELVIREQWFRLTTAVALVGAAIGLVVVGRVLYEVGWGRLHSTPDADSLLAFLSGVALLLVAALYWAVAGVLNVTEITASDETLRGKCGPVPWLGHVELEAAAIDQLYVRRGERRVRRAHHWAWQYDVIPFYRLAVRDRRGRVTMLSRRYESPYTPRVLEYLLESRLGIEDRLIADEVHGAG